MKKINELEKLRDDTTGDILRMLHDRVSAIAAKLEANTPEEPVDNKVDNKKTQVDDTHRTVTLRIPKGMRVGEAICDAYAYSEDYEVVPIADWLLDKSDTDLQKALDEVEHE